MNVNAVKQGTRDPFLVFGHDGMRAGARFLITSEESTGVGMDTNGRVFRA